MIRLFNLHAFLATGRNARGIVLHLVSLNFFSQMQGALQNQPSALE